MKTLRTLSLFGMMICAAPAFAQSSGSFARPSGGSAGAAMGTATVGSFRSGFGGERLDRSDGTWRDRRPGRRGADDRQRWARRGWYGYGIGISSGSTLDPQGGYFAEGAEAPAVVNGRPEYAYDRGYPYDHFGSARSTTGARAYDGYGLAERSCETEWTRDRRTGRQVSVRVCRN
jgi:hypothetical protein